MSGILSKKSEYNKRRAERLLAMGKCPCCGKRPLFEQRKLCEVCLNRSIDYSRKFRVKKPHVDTTRYRDRLKRGICPNCGAAPCRPGRRSCEGCTYTERERAARTKAEVMARYGGACACCGENRAAFLTLDHIKNDGNAKRKSGEHQGGGRLYQRLLRMPVVPGLRVLCWNCNLGRRFTGVCPHTDDSFFSGALARQKYTRRRTFAMIGDPDLDAEVKPMREQVWFIGKRGDERRFTTPNAPAPEWAANLRREGYTIFRIEFEMPGEWDNADAVVAAALEENVRKLTALTALK